MTKLTLVAVLLFAGYCALPTNDRIRTSLRIYLSKFPEEWRFYNEDRDPERLSSIYHGSNFIIPNTLKQQLGPDDVVIIPPKDYLLRHLSAALTQWTEPKYFYYVAGPIHTVPWSEARPDSVTHALLFTGKGRKLKLQLVPIDSPEAFEHVRSTYESAPES